jgi:hypothetical protein
MTVMVMVMVIIIVTRGVDSVTEPRPMGHKYCGIVEEVGRGGCRQAWPIRHRIILCVG